MGTNKPRALSAGLARARNQPRLSFVMGETWRGRFLSTLGHVAEERPGVARVLRGHKGSLFRLQNLCF